MEFTKLSKVQLLVKCDELGITKCKSKTKKELIELIQKSILKPTVEIVQMPLPLPHDSFKFIDLFCGIGGFHQALSNINGTCVFACDIDDNCREIYKNNYGLTPAGDITKINIESIPSFDVLCGGFPCQPFSKAGFQKGFDDNRGNLFFNICSIVEHHHPKYIILENVQNLATHDNGNTWNVIRHHIRQLGYQTYDDPIILNVLHFNIPQNRERVVILCKRNDLGPLPVLPEINKTPKLSLTRYVSDIIIEDDHNQIYQIQGKLLDVHDIWNSFVQLLVQHSIPIPKFPLWSDWWDNIINPNDEFYIKYTGWINKNQEFYSNHKHILENWLITSRQNPNWLGAVRKFEWQAGDLTIENNSLDKCLWSSRGSGIRVKKCDYIPALVAMSMIPVYGPENRKLTPKELLKAQSFKDDFKYNEKTIYKQLGNAVNVKMIEQCARFLMFNESLF